MLVKITQGCYVNNEPRKIGDVVETAAGNLLIGMGKAVPHVEVKQPVAEKPAKKVKGND